MSKNESVITDNISTDQQLIEEGTTQLNSEIQVLETWLRELDATDVNDVEVIAARKSYNDMLRSRKEILSTLAKQAKLQAVPTEQKPLA